MASASLQHPLRDERAADASRRHALARPDSALVNGWRWSVGAPRVLQLVPALDDSEDGRAAIDAARGLAESGGSALVASTGGRLAHILNRHGAAGVTLPLTSRHPATVLRLIERLAALAYDQRVAVLHARSAGTAWLARRVAGRLGLPVVTSAHAIYAPRRRWQRFKARPIAAGDRITAVSGYVAERLQKYLAVPQTHLRLVPGGVDMDTFDPDHVTPERIIQLAEAWHVPDDRKTIMLPARFAPGKGHRLLVEALSRLERRDYVCLLVGTGDDRDSVQAELGEMIAARGLGDRVRLVTSCHDMAAAYMLADVVAAPATHPRPFGRIAVEAQAMGRPVIAADHGGPSETVRRGYTGWLVPPGDADALAATLDQALDLDGDTRAWLGAQARAHVAERYDRRNTVRRTLAVYDELLAHPRDPQAGQAHFQRLVGYG